MIPEAAPLDMPPEVDAQQQRLAAVQAQLEQHPLYQLGNASAIPQTQNQKHTTASKIAEHEALS